MADLSEATGQMLALQSYNCIEMDDFDLEKVWNMLCVVIISEKSCGKCQNCYNDFQKCCTEKCYTNV